MEADGVGNRSMSRRRAGRAGPGKPGWGSGGRPGWDQAARGFSETSAADIVDTSVPPHLGGGMLYFLNSSNS